MKMPMDSSQSGPQSGLQSGPQAGPQPGSQSGPQSGQSITTSGLVNISSKEELIRQKLEEERVRLAREVGIESHHMGLFKRPVENPFTKSQRASTTLLFGGLT